MTRATDGPEAIRFSPGLSEDEVYRILGGAGFSTPRRVFLPGPPRDELPAAARSLLAESPGGVVLKIVAAGLLHKSESGGVAFERAEEKDILISCERMWEAVRCRAPKHPREGILLVERLVPFAVSPAAETLFSFRSDPAFGPALAFGLGGLLTEWQGEVAHGESTVVLEPGRVEEGLRRAATSLPAFRLLFRTSRLHDQPPLDLHRVSATLENLARSAILHRHGELLLQELEINPILLTADGRWVAVDGKARLGPEPVPSAPRPIPQIRSLLEPRSAAVLGASGRVNNPGRIILKNLKSAEGISYGHLYAVHPREAEIEGVRCVSSVGELPETVDLAVVAIPAEGARDAIVALCRERKARSVILIPGGFAETGRSDLEREIRDALASARASGEGPVLVGGNCLGVVSKRRYNTFFLPQYKLPFHDAPGDALVAISQSGAYLVSLTSNLDGIVFPRASISYGNQVDLTVADFLDYFEEDPRVGVLACYIEGFAPLDGRRFVDAARRITRSGRRVVAFKAGKTPLGAEAARSHTASLAGDYEVARALLSGAGVLVADSLDEFEDAVKALTMLGGREVAGNRVAILSNAGFECSTVLDRMHGLVPAQLAGETRARLTKVLPAIAHADNPVDATPMADTAAFIGAAEALLKDPGVDALLVSPVPVTPALDNLAPDLAGTHGENIYSPGSLPQELLRLYRESRKPIAANVDSGRLYDDFVMVLQRGGIPVWRKIDRASRALSMLVRS